MGSSPPYWQKRTGGNREEQGYGTAWIRLRVQILKRDMHLCQVCARADRVTVATQVDHIVNKATWLKRHGTQDGVDDPSNLQSICKPCHDDKTTQEHGGRVRPTIGPDGYPVEE